MHEELGPATNASYLLLNLTIEDACSSGARYYYLGESGRSKGIALYKERFGGIGYPYPEIRRERIPVTRANKIARKMAKRIVRYRES